MEVYLNANKDISYTNLHYANNGVYRVNVIGDSELHANSWGEI